MFDDSNDQSGTVGVLIGFIVLVFVAVGLSLLADNRFQFSSNRISIEEAVAGDAVVLEKLHDQLESAQEEWRASSRPLEGQGEQVKLIKARVAASAGQLPDLRSRRDLLAKEVGEADAAFRDYQDRFRRQVRGEATGEKHAELLLTSGRTYTDVAIRRVTSAGIEITHSHGITRVKPKELDATWNERFQWDQEEVEKVLAAERAREERHRKMVEKANSKPALPAKKTKPMSKAKLARKEAAERVALLRRDVIDARNLWTAAESEVENARSEARSNRGRSVPGSLETWEAKARRLEVASAKLREKYDLACGRLAVVSPSDPLLREPMN